MKTLLFAYYVVFCLDVWPQFMRYGYQRREVYAVAHEVAFDTTASPDVGLRLMQIAGHESGFYRGAVGKRGERGPWQVLGGNDFSAREALRRMALGMVSFVGCRHASDAVVLPEGTKTTCQEMVDNRIGPADRYFATHPAPPPTALVDDVTVAGNP